MQVEGVPEGWELVRFGQAMPEDCWLDHNGDIREEVTCGLVPIIRKVAPACTWPHGVFADGWIVENMNGRQRWLNVKPNNQNTTHWAINEGMSYCEVGWIENLVNPPVFRADLPWDQRIQQVGPTIEAKLKGGA